MDSTNQTQLGIDQNTLVIGLAVSVILIIALMVVVILQNRRIHYLEQPKYGFLGKPLNMFLAAMLLVGGVGLSIYSSNGINDISTSDPAKPVQLLIQSEVRGVVGDERLVFLSVSPIVDGVAWGDAKAEYDVFWSINGTDSVSTYETDLTSGNRGGVEIRVSPGLYQVRVDVTYGIKSWSKTETFTF